MALTLFFLQTLLIHHSFVEDSNFEKCQNVRPSFSFICILLNLLFIRLSFPHQLQDQLKEISFSVFHRAVLVQISLSQAIADQSHSKVILLVNIQ